MRNSSKHLTDSLSISYENYIRGESRSPFRTVSEFFSALQSADLLSRCGGPYPNDILLQPVSYDYALERAGSVLLDVNPYFAIDKMIVAASRAAHHGPISSSVWEHITWMLGWSREARAVKEADKKLPKIVGQILPPKRVDTQFGRGWADGVVIEDYVLNLLTPIVSLVVLERISEYPKLMQVAQVLLYGYLPVDIANEALDDVIMLY